MDEKENTRELVVVDVKRYKKVKRALQESEERYRELFENVPIGIYRTTPDGRFIDANPALVKMLGYGSFEELAARNLEKDYFDIEYPRSHYVARLKRDGEIKGLEAVWRRKDGTRIHVRENVKLISSQGPGVFFEGTVEDITQNKQAEEVQRVRTQQIEILNNIISKGNLAESLDDMLEVILDCLIQPLDFDTAALFLYDPGTKKMNLRAFRGVKKNQHLKEKYLAVENLPFSKVLGGVPVYVDHAREALPDLARSWGWRMASSIPLLAKGRVIGALNMASRKRQVFSFEEKNILEMIGKEAGTLISKLQTETALRESEKYYRTLIDISPDIIVVLDLNATLLTINQQFLKIGGYFYNEAIGASAYDFITGLDLGLLKKRTTAFIKKNEVSKSEYPFRKKDGSSVLLEVSATLLHDVQGRPKGIIAIGRDISVRKRDEEQLVFLSSITENTSDAIIVTDTDFCITYINKVAENFFGYRLDELKGKTPDIFNAEPEAERIQQETYKIISSGKIHLRESLNRRKDGSTFYCEYKVMPLKDKDGAIYAYSSVQRDISERKRSQEVLRQSEETFRRTFEAIPDPAYIWTKEADGRVLLSKFNQAALQITDGGIKEFFGIQAEVLFVDQPDYVKKIHLAMESGQRQFSEVHYHFRTTGESKWLLVDYVKTAESSVMVITKDVTERKEAETRLLAYQEQLRALTSELTLIEEKERRRIASELHDQIGQNLALCKLKVAALENNQADSALKGELAAVSRLLECSIQDARSLIFDLSPPVLYELGFTAALEWLAERIQEQFHVPIEFESRFDEPELDNDRQVILFQVIRELLVNVGKHSRASQAKVILSFEAPFLKIQVNDNGVGFDASTIFNPREQNGGFGFFSMRERLNYLGGGLEVKSKPGKGSQIILTVPPHGRAAAAKGKNL